MKRIVSAAVMLLSAAGLSAASLFDLTVDFETPAWSDVLRNGWGPLPEIVERDGGGHAMKIAPGRSRTTQPFPLPAGGRPKVEFEVRNHGIVPGGESWRVAQICVVWYRDSKRITHNDLYLDERQADWKTVVRQSLAAPIGANRFSISITNYGKSGTFEIDNFRLSLEVDGEKLTGDSFFDEKLGVNHWYPETVLKDWDGMRTASPGGSAVIEQGQFSAARINSLKLRNNATVRSARFPYEGERLIVGAWARRKGITRTVQAPPWASAGMQMVWFGSDGKVVKNAHGDIVPLQDGTVPWTWYQWELPAGDKNRQCRSFELWPRIWPTAAGELELTGITAIRMEPSSAGSVYDEKSGEIKIDAANPGEPIPVIWNAMDMCFADMASLQVVRDGLTRLRKEAGITRLRLREFLQGGQIYQGLSGGGEVMLDFTRLDRWMDFLVKECGFILTPTIESTPNALSSRPDATPGFRNIHPPRDYDRWAEVVQRLVEHWVDRYGADTVSQWDFECWNEPRAGGYFKGTDEEFVKLYGAYLKALKAVEKSRNVKLRIGTASDVSMSSLYSQVFDDRQKKGDLAEVDFISMHSYNGYFSSIYGFGNAARSIAELRDSYPELKGKPVYMTEFNGSDREHPANDRHTGCAFNIKAIRIFLDGGVARAYHFVAVSSIYHGIKDKHFSEGLETITKSGIAKAVFHSFGLLNALKETRRLELKADHDPFDGIAGITPDGKVRAVLTTFAEENLLSGNPTKLTVRVRYPNPPASPKIRLTRVDRDHGDPYPEYERRGKPAISETPNLAGELNPVTLPGREEVSGWSIEGDTLVIPLNLQLNGGYLLEID